VLDADHAGLDDVKDRIVEYLAVRKRREERGLAAVGGRRSGAVLALVGPPGVGKTSLGESVARAMGPQVRPRRARRRARRGGDPRPPAHLRRRAARPDRARDQGGRDDEPGRAARRDRQGRRDYRGDPSAALLEVLDPAQNHTFRDHYLEVELDLSDVVFLATANVLDTIPGPLLDRMELVRSTATPRTRRSRSPATTCCRVSSSGPV
jgi:ATP-dependent Lon protease